MVLKHLQSTLLQSILLPKVDQSQERRGMVSGEIPEPATGPLHGTPRFLMTNVPMHYGASLFNPDDLKFFTIAERDEEDRLP